MKYLFLLACLLILTQHSRAQAQASLFAPFREGQSNYLDKGSVSRAKKHFEGKDVSFLQRVKELLAETQKKANQANYEDLISGLEDIYAKEFEKLRNPYFVHGHILTLLRDSQLIDDIAYRLLLDHVKQAYQPYQETQDFYQAPTGPAIQLGDYLVKKAALRKRFLETRKYPDEVVVESQANPFPIKQYKVSAKSYSNLSAKERLYYLYSPDQIRHMASIIGFALNIADAKNVYTTVEFRNDDAPLILNHSPTDQYRLALRLMRMQKGEAEASSGRIGVGVSDLDLIASAYELGIISYDELSLIVGNKDFYLPEVSFPKKVIRYLTDLGTLAFRVHPATAPYAIIPMILYNSYQEIQKSQNMIDENSFIFSMPKR